MYVRKSLAKISCIVATLPVVAYTVLFTGQAYAASSSLSLSSATSSVAVGSTLQISVRLNTGGDPVNAVQANLSYPSTIFDSATITSTAAFDVVAENSVSNGKIRIGRGAMSPVTGMQDVAIVTLHAASPGSATISFDPIVSSQNPFGTAAYRSTDNVNTLTTTSSSTYTVSVSSDTSAPSAPTGATAQVLNANQVNLAWNASLDTGGSGMAGYNVYRNGTKLNTGLITATSYGDSTVLANTTYTYKVEAVDGAGNKSPQANTVPLSVTTTKLGDVTGGSNGSPDGKIDINDVSYVILKYGTSDTKADITGAGGKPDGKVDINDVSLVISKFGQ